jgi:hypothetical protein
MKVRDLVQWHKDNVKLPRHEYNRARTLYLDSKFSTAYSWGLAHKILAELLQFNGETNRGLDDLILD